LKNPSLIKAERIFFVVLLLSGSVAVPFQYYTSLVFAQVDETTPTADTSTFTISGWIKPDYSNGSYEFTIISKENSFVLSLNNNIEPKHIATFSIFDGIKWTYVESTSTISEQWTHISATFDGKSIKIYINGKLDAVTELANPITISVNGTLVKTHEDTIYSNQDIVIGARVSTNDGSPQLQNKFSGEINDISVNNSIFDEQKLNQTYHEQFDHYSTLDVELSVDEIIQQITRENALAAISTSVPTNSTLDLIPDSMDIGKSVPSTQDIVIGARVSTNDGSPQLQNKFSGEINDISVNNSIFDEQKLNQTYHEQFDHYSTLDVELSVNEMIQQITRENALAAISTSVPTNSTLDLVHDSMDIGKSIPLTQNVEISDMENIDKTIVDYLNFVVSNLNIDSYR
jgi:hypothetical protein